MQGIDRKNYIPNPTSPRGGRRACLCKNNTYSIKCCDGDNCNSSNSTKIDVIITDEIRI